MKPPFFLLPFLLLLSSCEIGSVPNIFRDGNYRVDTSTTTTKSTTKPTTTTTKPTTTVRTTTTKLTTTTTKPTTTTTTKKPTTTTAKPTTTVRTTTTKPTTTVKTTTKLTSTVPTTTTKMTTLISTTSTTSGPSCAQPLCQCEISMTVIEDSKSPCIVDEESGQWAEVDLDNFIVVNNTKNIIFYCPGTTFKYSDINKSAQNGTITASCISGELKINGITRNYDKFECEDELEAELISDDSSNNRILNPNDYAVYEVGFSREILFHADDTLKAYSVIFHKTFPYTPVYTVHRINSNLAIDEKKDGGSTNWKMGKRRRVDRAGNDRPFGEWTLKDIDASYTRINQMKAFQADNFDTESFFYEQEPNLKDCAMFEKGHLTPNADFDEKGKRSATYTYVNAAPQWQPFNERNWKNLEFSIREHVVKNQNAWGTKPTIDEDDYREVIIYTGVSTNFVLDLANTPNSANSNGQMKLKDQNNNPTDVFIKSGAASFPIPTYFWKIVVNNEDELAEFKLAVAFIGINLPNSAFDPSTDYQKGACKEPIKDIFKSALQRQKYILFEEYKYGNIFACDLKDILLPEMIHARGEMGWKADSWKLLETK